MIDVFERAERMRDALDRIRQRVREVVHRVDAPRVAGAVMLGVADAIEHRIAHVMFGERHVDLRAQHVGAVGELAGAHAAEQIEILVDAAVAVRRVLARLGQRAAILADLVGRQRIDVGDALADQALGELIELLVVVRRVVFAVVPVEPQPPHVVLDRVDVLDVLLDRVGVVEAEVAVAAELAGDAEVEADRLGVADVQVAVRLGRKARDDAAAVLSGGDVGGDDLANEVLRAPVRARIRVRHAWQTIRLSQNATTEVLERTLRLDSSELRGRQSAAQGAPARTARTISGLRPRA